MFTPFCTHLNTLHIHVYTEITFTPHTLHSHYVSLLVHLFMCMLHAF